MVSYNSTIFYTVLSDKLNSKNSLHHTLLIWVHCDSTMKKEMSNCGMVIGQKTKPKSVSAGTLCKEVILIGQSILI